ncbi:MAG: GNAT family N-acetyltransferase [Marinibacterium sp.]
MAVDIQRADPTSPDMAALIAAHLDHSYAHSPDASVHAMAADALAGPGFAFYGLFLGETALGCGALKVLGGGVVEVKSVHVRRDVRRRGLARQLMLALIGIARRDGHGELVLETGSDRVSGYDAARRLYERLGFEPCGPIPGYAPDPNSAFYRLRL